GRVDEAARRAEDEIREGGRGKVETDQRERGRRKRIRGGRSERSRRGEEKRGDRGGVRGGAKELEDRERREGEGGVYEDGWRAKQRKAVDSDTPPSSGRGELEGVAGRPADCLRAGVS